MLPISTVPDSTSLTCLLDNAGWFTGYRLMVSCQHVIHTLWDCQWNYIGYLYLALSLCHCLCPCLCLCHCLRHCVCQCACQSILVLSHNYLIFRVFFKHTLIPFSNLLLHFILVKISKWWNAIHKLSLKNVFFNPTSFNVYGLTFPFILPLMEY